MKPLKTMTISEEIFNKIIDSFKPIITVDDLVPYQYGYEKKYRK